jgi:hypothetical protein
MELLAQAIRRINFRIPVMREIAMLLATKSQLLLGTSNLLGHFKFVTVMVHILISVLSFPARSSPLLHIFIAPVELANTFIPTCPQNEEAEVLGKLVL